MQTFVEFLVLGVQSQHIRVCPERDESKVNPPENCYGFRFFDQDTHTVNGRVFSGERQNVSTYYYGQRFSLDEAKAFHSKENILELLISYMEKHQLTSLVETRFGQYIALQDGDTVLPI